MQNACMVSITIRDVPEPVRAALAAEAKRRGQSLQAFLLAVLGRQADFAYNSEILLEIEEGFGRHGGGLGADAPSASDVLAEARAEADGEVGAARSRRR